MLERIDQLVFYFTIECANCHNVIKVSHVVISEKEGKLYCCLCGKEVKVPDYENLVSAAQTLNDYLSDSLNAKYVNLVLNEKYKIADDMPSAH